MDVGFFTAHEQHPPRTLIEHAQRAEDAGFDSIWTSDHFHPWWHTDAHCGAAWPWLGAALEATDRIRFGTGVTPPIGRYHPGLLAQFAATLGAMYPGRFHLTLATGEAMNERPLGYEWPDYPERRARLVDACRIIQRLWTGEFVDYDGHHWSLDAARLYTTPDEPIPLYVAGNGVHTAEVAGRYADGFLTLVDPDTYAAELHPALEAGARRADRSLDDIHVVRQQGVSWAPDYEDAVDAVEFWTGTMTVGFDERVADPREIEARGRDEIPRADWPDWGVVTDDIDAVVREIERHEQAGFDEIEFLSTSPDQTAFIDAMRPILESDER